VTEFVGFFAPRFRLARNLLMLLQETQGKPASMLRDTQSVMFETGVETMRQLTKVILAIAAVFSTAASNATSMVLTFEGVTPGGYVDDYYNGGPGGNLGVSFTAPAGGPPGGALALTNSLGPPGFSNEPSASTVFQPNYTTIMTTIGGVYGFSFYYSSVDGYGTPGIARSVVINGTTFDVPASPDSSTCGGVFPGLCAWSLFTYTGGAPGPYALTVDFTGLGYQFLIDNVTIVPEPASLALVGLGILGAGFASRRRLRA
jgi:PEP-CTERM motif